MYLVHQSVHNWEYIIGSWLGGFFLCTVLTLIAFQFDYDPYSDWGCFKGCAISRNFWGTILNVSYIFL